MRRWGALAVLVVVTSYTALAQSPVPPGSGVPRPDAVAIARVGTLRIPRSQFESRMQSATESFRARNGSEVPDAMVSTFRREVLERLIRSDLLILEARRRGIIASPAEAEEILKHDPFFNPGGRFDPVKFAAVKAANTPTFQQALAELRTQLAGQKLQRQLETENLPSDSLLRSVAMRSLAHLSLDYLDLDPRLFDGHYREPTEREVLDYYRGHAQEFKQGERAELSVIFVDRPTLTDSLRRVSGQVQAWTERLHQRADSALAAIRSGASFEEIGERFGGARSHVVVLRDNFPGYWLGSREQAGAVFQARPGSLLSDPVPSNPGFLVVRVDSRTTDHLASIAEVSRSIRRGLRDDARLHGDERAIATLYAELGDSLRGPAVKVRFATADTAAQDPGEPSDAEVDRFYRGHLADYSTFDSRTGNIQSLSLADVRGDVRLRWRHERRGEMAQALAEALQRTWKAGRRDAALERSATLFRDAGPVPSGTPPDTGLAGWILGDSIQAGGTGQRVSLAPYERGFLVFQVYEALANFRPSLEQARGPLQSILEGRQKDRDRAAARAWFDRDPSIWAGGNSICLSRFIIVPRGPDQIQLTRSDVERYYRDHFDEYSSPEVVRARHILISPTGPGAAADRIARARADSLLAALRAGADFVAVARRTSDDPATRTLGGDLGQFGRGALLAPVERAAFALKAGELSEPVHSTEGYHLIQCLEHLPTYAQPFGWVYGNVGYDAAKAKGEALAKSLADSVFRRIHTPTEARAAAAKLGLTVEPNVHHIGNRVASPDVRPYLIKLETVKPGQLYPGPHLLFGMGYAITWVDSITAPQRPRWAQVEIRLLEEYSRGAAFRAVQEKFNELDSMSTAGWSLDSLGALWGGLVRKRDVQIGTGFSELPGSRTVFDSLLFGARGGRPLEPGSISGWTAIPGHFIRLRLLDRSEPRPAEMAQRMETDRRAALDRAMRPVFDELAQRFGVQIFDPDLSRVSLPPPPPAPMGMP